MESETDFLLGSPEDFQSVESETSPREAGAFPPYFRVPNAVYDIGLTPYEVLVITYLLRRANKGGQCFPSLTRISRDTGIKSQNTIRKALRSLMKRRLISLVSGLPGKVPIYHVNPWACEAAVSKVSPSGKSKNEPLRSSGEGVNSEGVKTSMTEPTPSSGEGVPLHLVNPTPSSGEPEVLSFKEDSLKYRPPVSFAPPQGGLTLADSEKSACVRVLESKDSLQTEKNPLAEVNRFYYSLAPVERGVFDREARRLHRSDTEPTIGEDRTLRCKFFELAQFARSTYRLLQTQKALDELRGKPRLALPRPRVDLSSDGFCEKGVRGNTREGVAKDLTRRGVIKIKQTGASLCV